MLKIENNFRASSLCGHPVGCIMRHAHLSVCLVRISNWKTKKHRKIKISVNIPHGTSKSNANFQLNVTIVLS